MVMPYTSFELFPDLYPSKSDNKRLVDKSTGLPSVFLKAELEGKRIGYPVLTANIHNTILNCPFFWCPRGFWSPGQHMLVRFRWMSGVPEGHL